MNAAVCQFIKILSRSSHEEEQRGEEKQKNKVNEHFSI